jgi:hypothetical protein
MQRKVEFLINAIDKSSPAFVKIGKAAAFMNKKMNESTMAHLKKSSQHLANYVKIMGVATAGVIAAVGNTFVKTAMSYEKMQSILQTTEGSLGGAKKAMMWVSKFATQTPYELEEVTKAYVRLRAYGLDPTHGLLKSLGNASAAMGKDLMASVEMMSDAIMGENERLKEFGIKAKKDKGSGTTTYQYTDKKGKDQTKVVKSDDRKGIQKAIMEIFDERYEGAMARMSKTLGGIFSNLADTWGRFQLMVMDSGLFDMVKKDAQGILDILNQMGNDGSLEKTSKKVADVIKEVYGVIKEVFGYVWPVLKGLVVTIDQIATAFGGWGNLIKTIGLVALIPTVVSLVSALVSAYAAVQTFVSGFAMASAVLGSAGAIAAGLPAFLAPIAPVLAAINWPLLAIGLAVLSVIKSFDIWSSNIPVWQKICLTLVSPFLVLWDALKLVISGITNFISAFNKIPNKKEIEVSSKNTGESGSKPNNKAGSSSQPNNRNRGVRAVAPPKKKGTRAGGGMVNRGMGYMVGEGGRELFTPSQNGFITPAHKLGGGGQQHIVIDLNLNQAGQLQLAGVSQDKTAPLKVNANLGKIR